MIRTNPCISLILLISLLSSCSTMNSQFSCRITATDHCLTIEEVDDMTRWADKGQSIPPSTHLNKDKPHVRYVVR